MEPLDERVVAAGIYNRCWELLEKEHRSRDEDIDLLTTAFASRYHWSIAGEQEQWIIADWMVSRAAAAIGETALAVAFAHLAHDAVTSYEAPDWLVASCAEGLARAYAAAGSAREREQWFTTADLLVTLIIDDESRLLIAEQLASVPK